MGFEVGDGVGEVEVWDLRVGMEWERVCICTVISRKYVKAVAYSNHRCHRFLGLKYWILIL